MVPKYQGSKGKQKNAEIRATLKFPYRRKNRVGRSKKNIHFGMGSRLNALLVLAPQPGGSSSSRSCKPLSPGAEWHLGSANEEEKHG